MHQAFTGHGPRALLKYDEEGVLMDILLLDFQVTAYCNVGNDLAHFMLCSTTKEFRDEHLKAMLKLYHQKLHETVNSVPGFQMK